MSSLLPANLIRAGRIYIPLSARIARTQQRASCFPSHSIVRTLSTSSSALPKGRPQRPGVMSRMAASMKKKKMTQVNVNEKRKEGDANRIRRRPSPSRSRLTAKQIANFPRHILPNAGLTPSQLAALSVGSSASSKRYSDTLKEILFHANSLDSSISDSSCPMSSSLIELVSEELRLPLKFESESIIPLFSTDEISSSTSSKQVNDIKKMPVVTIMGHVDHGKTSLLDTLRKTNVVDTEEGGITQSVAAFQVNLPTVSKDACITFVDTPGHKAFSTMRLNGVIATDVIVLVVAINDGVMPQTKECIELAKDSNIPVIVALNKCDLEDTQPDKVYTELLQECQLEVEQVGGQTQCIHVSAKSGQGIQDLLEAIILETEDVQSSDKELDNKRGKLICLESRVDKSLGNVATVIIKQGHIQIGDYVVLQNKGHFTDDHGRSISQSGELHGKVKMIIPSEGTSQTRAGISDSQIKHAGIGQAVGIVGLGNALKPGCEVWVAENEKEARLKAKEIEGRNSAAKLTIQNANHILNERKNKAIKTEQVGNLMKYTPTSSDNHEGPGHDMKLEVPLQIVNGNIVPLQEEEHEPVEEENEEHKITSATKGNNLKPKPCVQVVIKGDVRGSADAVAQCMQRLSDDEIDVRIVHIGLGDVTDADISLSSASNLFTKKSKKKRHGKTEPETEDKWILAAFNVRVRESMRKAAISGGVHVVRHGIIYELEDEIKKIMDSMREDNKLAGIVGKANVLRVFENGQIAGCMINDGIIHQGAKVRVKRQTRKMGGMEEKVKDVVFEGVIDSIKQFSKDVRTITKGFECGIRVGGWDEFQDGDEIEAIG